MTTYPKLRIWGPIGRVMGDIIEQAVTSLLATVAREQTRRRWPVRPAAGGPPIDAGRRLWG